MTWSVVGVSVAGTSHLARGLPCQDAARVSVFGPNGDWLVVVVADGAGSATFAEVGANLVCDVLHDRVRQAEPESLLRPGAVESLIAEARTALFAEAERRTVTPRELACTILLALVGPAAAVFAQIGDGSIVVGEAGYRSVVFWPEPCEYANATNFLTDTRYAESIRVEVVDGALSEVSVFTDGLQRIALEFAKETPHDPFFDPLFARVRDTPDPSTLADPLRSFLDSPRVNERTDDDKTLVLATRRQ